MLFCKSCVCVGEYMWWALERGVLQAAFRKIREATGVSDVNEIIQKFTTQGDTTESLRRMTQEGQDKIEGIRQEIISLKGKVRFNGLPFRIAVYLLTWLVKR